MFNQESEETGAKTTLGCSANYCYIEEPCVKNYFNHLVKKNVDALIEALDILEPKVKAEAKLQRKKFKEDKLNYIHDYPLLKQKRQLVRQIKKYNRSNLLKPIAGDGSSVAKKIGTKILGYFDRFGKIEYEWINSNQYDPLLLQLFDYNKTRIFDGKSNILKYFSLLLNCNICSGREELFTLLGQLNISEKLFYLFLDQEQKPKYFSLIFKVKVYDCGINDDKSMTDSLELTFAKQNQVNENLNKTTQVKYLYYDFQLKTSYPKLIELRLREQSNQDIETALFQFNAKTKSLNLKFNKTNLRHNDLIE